MLLAITDCLANIYNVPAFLVRLSKFFVYLMPLAVILAFNQYLMDFLQREKLKSVNWIVMCGFINLVLSLFTGWYYKFGDNGYERGRGYIVSYIFPIIAMAIQFFVVITNRKNIRRKMLYPMLLFIIFPMMTSIAHIFVKGISLTSFSIVLMVVLLYSFSIMDTNQLIMTAHQKEVEALQEKERNSKLMIGQITSALVEAIDAKDSYTQGHSRRVSEYSIMIAKRAGKTEQECNEIEFVSLLHDVGKIGIPSSIINKAGKLDDEEFRIMKRHPLIGRDILDKITISANLRIGACYHHERYDGRGYPFGMKGEEIPEIARIIAVADAYDAMTSKRSYRDALPQEFVREQLEKGIGTQFDPKYAKIMLELVNEDKEYKLKQH